MFWPTVDVYVAPLRPYAGSPAQGPGDDPNSRFPGELPRTRVVPEVMAEPEFALGGEVLRAVSVGQGDAEHSTFLHVPSLDAVDRRRRAQTGRGSPACPAT